MWTKVLRKLFELAEGVAVRVVSYVVAYSVIHSGVVF